MARAAESTSNEDECKKFKDTILGGILKYGGIFRGMTYGDYLREWVAWLHAEEPFYRGYRSEICYLRGNVSYYYDKDTGIRKQAEEFNNNARNKKDKIFRGAVVWTDTAIFVPVMAAFYSVGERVGYRGGLLQSVAECQSICRTDINQGGARWCTLEKKGLPKDCKLDLKDKVFYYEAPSFKLTVTENSPLREHFEQPIEPGTYDTFTSAYAIMINTSNTSYLPAGEYRLRYGGFGRGSYSDDSVQDFIVQSDPGWPSTSPKDSDVPPDHDGLAEL